MPSVVLVRYNVHSGDKISESRVSGSTLHAALKAAVIKGYKSGDDFHVVPDDGSPTSRAYWFGRHWHRLKGGVIVDKDDPSKVWALETQVRAAIQKQSGLLGLFWRGR